MDLFLQDGARVGIIGGGPSGSFTAIHLLTTAASLNKKIRVFIFDKKDFTSSSGCNFCAGILSNTLIKELSKYNIIIPPEIIQREIKGYHYETREGTAYFPKPSTSSIFSVFRANGPCILKELYNVSFDYFLLQEAIKRGANKIDSNINEIIFPSSPQDRVSLYSREQNTYYEFELVFGAFGINTPFIKKLEKSGIGYKAPQYLHSGQAEIPYDISLDKKFHDNVTVFLIPLKNLYFFSFTPKAKYLTVTAIGPHVTKTMLEEIFAIPQVMEYFPDKWRFPSEYCHCHPRIPVTIAENFFYHRFVVVGDACWSRYLKDGITSAFYTSKFGVECAFKYGISRNAFRDRYFRKITQMDKDNTIGKILFKIHNRFTRLQTVRGSLFSMTINYSHQTIQENVRYILWGLFTGDYSYKKIMKRTFRISFIMHFIINIINAYLKIMFNNLSKINKKTKLRPLKK